MAKTDANKGTTKKTNAKAKTNTEANAKASLKTNAKAKTKTSAKAKNIVKVSEPETVAEAKKLEEKPYWQLTDDEVLLRSPEPDAPSQPDGDLIA